jgi:hypothetical protein
MASILEGERHPSLEANRRTALVALLLSPKPSTLLKIMVAMCCVWTAFLGWGAVSLIKLMLS